MIVTHFDSLLCIHSRLRFIEKVDYVKPQVWSITSSHTHDDEKFVSFSSPKKWISFFFYYFDASSILDIGFFWISRFIGHIRSDLKKNCLSWGRNFCQLSKSSLIRESRAIILKFVKIKNILGGHHALIPFTRTGFVNRIFHRIHNIV